MSSFLDSTKPFESSSFMSYSGADLAHYRNKLREERSSRTLALRKLINRRESNKFMQPKSTPKHLIEAIDANESITILNSKDENKIESHFTELIQVSRSCSKAISQIIKSQEFIEILIESLGVPFQSKTIVLLIDVLIEVFNYCSEDMQNEIVDNVMGCMLDLLNVNDVAIVSETLLLTRIMCSLSEYARDAMLCFGLFDRISEITEQEDVPSLAINACGTLHSILETSGEIDRTVILSFLNRLVQLLSKLPLKQEINEILDTLIEITNKAPSLAFNLFQLGISERVLAFLDDPELQSSSLKLIGNLCLSQPEQVKKLIELGLFERIILLFHSEHASDILWILSNALECLPEVVCLKFDGEFIEQLVNISHSCNYDIKKEIAYLLATLIIFSSDDMKKSLIQVNIISILVEMLGCGSFIIILRCMCSLMACFHLIISTNSPALLNEFDMNELKERLNDLLEFNDKMIVERAKYFLSNISNL